MFALLIGSTFVVYAANDYTGYLDTVGNYTAVATGGIVTSKLLDNNETTYDDVTPSKFITLTLKDTVSITKIKGKSYRGRATFKDSSNVVLGTYDFDGSETYLTVNVNYVGCKYIVLGAQGSNTGVFDEFDIQGTVVDVTPPSVTSVMPTSGATGVNLTQSVVLTFNKNINASSGTASINGVSTNISYGANTITLTPITPYNFDTVYTVNVSGVVASNGIVMTSPYTSTFRTKADTPPSIQSVVPANNRTDVGINEDVIITFDQNVVDSGTVTLQDVSCTKTVLNNTIRLHPQSPLNYDTNYNISVSGVKNSNNTVMTSTFTSTFKTVKDTIPPEILSIIPPPGSINIPLDQVVQIKFSKNIDSNSIDNVFIKKGSDLVPINKTVSNDTISINFANQLENNLVYTIHVDGVEDFLGNVMQSNVDVQFSTIPDTGELAIVSYKPPSGTIPPTTSIEVEFNKNIEPSSIAYTFKDDYGNTVPCTAQTLGTKVTFKPSLIAGRKYTFNLTHANSTSNISQDFNLFLNFEVMASSGNQNFDDITSTNLKLFSDIHDKGFNFILIVIALGVIFIGAKWLWRKLRYWLENRNK